MHTTNPNRLAALIVAALALSAWPSYCQAPAKKTFPDQFQEKWEKSGPNVRIKRHQDGSRTEFRRSPDDRTLVKRMYGIQGAVRLVTVYRVGATGNPLACKIWDGKKNLLYKVSYGYNKTSGRLEAERMFDARVVRRDKNTLKEAPVRVMYYNYDAQGRPTKPEVYTFKEGMSSQEAYGPTFPHDNPFKGNR